MDDLLSDLAKLRAVMAPVFAEQEATRKEHLPAAMARATENGIDIRYVGGNCPVQSEGSFDGHEFYFRARGDSWQFHVGPDADRFTDREYYREQDYGSDFDAGWMNDHEAVDFIIQAVAEYRKARPNDRA